MAPIPKTLPMQRRAMTLALDEEALATRAEGDSRIPISLSSEAPVERWFGREILDHSKEAIDLTYARNGLPFLMDHDTRTQIGLLEEVKIGKDGKLRAMARPGNHPDATWVFADIRGGIRPNISVGYRVMELKLEESSDERGDTYRVTRWMPMEGSTVPVPADITVGAGRAASNDVQFPVNVTPHTSRAAEENKMPENPQAPAAGAAPAVVATRDYDAERKQRGTDLANIGKLITDPAKRSELMTQALVEDWAPSRMADEAFKANMASAAGAVPAGRIVLTEKEQKRYSVMRALAAGVPELAGKVDAGFEREISQEISQKTGRTPRGIYMPMTLTADRAAALAVRASVTGNVATTTSLGGAGVETSVQDIVEILRSESALIQLGVRYLPGLTGNQSFPRQITANTWSWEGENPSTEKTLTAATLDTFTLSPKTGMGATAYSKQFLVQSSFGAEQFVREDLGMIAALGIDSAGISGAGTGNQPTGILNLSGVATEVMGTHGANLTWANITNYEETQAVNNAAKGRLGFLLTPGIRRKLKNTLKNTVSGADYIWSDQDTLNKYPALVSNQVPSNLTKGTSTTICHGLVYGNWQEYIMASWGEALDVTVNPFTYAKQGMIEVVGLAMVDCNSRHPKSFVVTKDILV